MGEGEGVEIERIIQFSIRIKCFLSLPTAICVKYLELAGGTWSLTSGHVVGYPAPRAQGQANDNQLQEGQHNHRNCISKMTV